MKKLKKILIGLLLILVIVFLGALIYVRHIANKAIPDYNKNVELEGMTDEVVVYRDAYAIPHLFAKNEEDLYRAVGYIMAQDRLWQMDLVRRATTGRLAEIFGEELVETDLLMRSLRIPEKSQMVLTRTNPETINTLEAFVDGVNQYIEQNIKRLPPEFSILGYVPEPWRPEHSVNLIGYMAWDLTKAWEAEVILYKLGRELGFESEKFKDLIPDLSLQKTEVYPDFMKDSTELNLRSGLLSQSRRLEKLGLEVFSGSNNWAISGEKSVTGKPILANDMHLGFFAPGIWYQMHQVVEGKINVTGLVLPGQPFIVAGHNENIAWGMTNVMVDDMDFYLEKINPVNPNQYEFNGSWKNMEVRKQKIKTKNGDIIERQLKFTHRGPVISGFKKVGDYAISMRWIGNEYSNELRTLYFLNRASNWEEFKNAVRTFISISQNIIYADVHGNIGLYCCAGVPLRKGNAIFIAPGETSEYDWTGLVPFEELPHSYNPPDGMVSSANNKIVGEDYPYYISRWFILPYRIDRIREMLGEKQKYSIEDFKQIQADQKSKLVEKMKERIISELKKSETYNLQEKQSLNILSDWDGILSKESPAAAIFEKLYVSLVKNIFIDEMGKELYEEYISMDLLSSYVIDRILTEGDSEWCDDVLTEHIKETFSDMIRKSFIEAVASLKAELGKNPEKWEWGMIHQLTIEHPMSQVKILDKIFNLSRGPYEAGGSFHTICAFSYDFNNPFKVYHGVSNRHIFSLANWDESLTVIPTGTSGIPASEFYCDQTRLYIENNYHNDFVSENLIKQAAIFKMVISGKK